MSIAGVLYGGNLTPATAQESDGGEEVWRFETEDRVQASPTVVDGTVYIGSTDHWLYAIEAESGEQRWRSEVTGPFEFSSPTVADGTVYAGSSYLYAFDTESGDFEWNFIHATDGNQSPGNSSPTVVDGTVYFGSGDHSVYAVDAESGKEVWENRTGYWVYSSPTVVNETLYVGSQDATLYAIDIRSGDDLWQFDVGQAGISTSSPTVVDGTVYVGAKDSYFYAVDEGSGEQRWRFETESPILGTPTVSDQTDSIYFGSTQKLYSLDLESGTVEWTFERGGTVDSSPTVVDDTVFVGTGNGTMYAIDATSGAERWHFETREGIESSPTVVDGTVYFGSNDGNVYAVNAGVSGSSDGSRVLLGTLGHHDNSHPGQPVQFNIPSYDPDITDNDGSQSYVDWLSESPAIVGISGGLLTLLGGGYLARRQRRKDG